ncbi:MAG: hypothetical protein A2X99_02665 [Deltaproteobacteria bacterium GWB2_55_19]|nr:MAG: hypothetical protein A2X99_02665 [Deltaproteobacteria bacterium GWB2_55_19]
MTSRIILFLAVYIAAHLFLCFSFARLFQLPKGRARIALFAGIFILGLSHILSIVLLRIDYNAFTRALYAITAAWTGLALNLLMTAVVCLILSLVFSLAGKRAYTRRAALALFTAAFLFSVYGVWNAFHPVIKTVEVDLPGLPEVWRKKTVLQITDAHLGAVYSPKHMEKMAERINSLDPDLIFITGDLFDGMSSGKLNDFVASIDSLKAKDGVFFVTGNHEGYIGLDLVFETLSRTKVKVLRDDVAIVDGVQIIGVDYPVYGAARDVEAIVRKRPGFKDGAPSILLYHTPTSIDRTSSASFGEHQSRTYLRPKVDFTAAKSLGVKVQLSGHTHGGQIYPFVWLADYLYNGYSYGLKRDGGFSIYISSGLGTFGPPMRTGTRPEIVVVRFEDAARAE